MDSKFTDSELTEEELADIVEGHEEDEPAITHRRHESPERSVAWMALRVIIVIAIVVVILLVVFRVRAISMGPLKTEAAETRLTLEAMEEQDTESIRQEIDLKRSMEESSLETSDMIEGEIADSGESAEAAGEYDEAAGESAEEAGDYDESYGDYSEASEEYAESYEDYTEAAEEYTEAAEEYTESAGEYEESTGESAVDYGESSAITGGND